MKITLSSSYVILVLLILNTLNISIGFKIPSSLAILSSIISNSSKRLISTEHQDTSSNYTSNTNTMNSSSTYQAILKQLYRINIYNPVKMGLDNTKLLYSHIGKPLENMYVVHVAGTNGKGSVSLKTAECLKRSGLRTGLFVSPHISSFRERVQINGEHLNEHDTVTMLSEVFDLVGKLNVPATFFEITTIMAFLKYKRSLCDAVVLEVGLGGRLDATNVVKPTLCVITSIQLDHTKILGDTIEKIAMEKAGIMKEGVNVLVGPGCPIDLLREEANRVGAPFYTLHDVLQPHERLYGGGNGSCNLVDIDDLNTDISRAALKLLQRHDAHLASCLEKSSVELGLQVRPPCRFEILCSKEGVTIILDIAHNEDAIVALIKKLQLKYPEKGVRFVIGMSSDKLVDKCIDRLIEFVREPKRIYCTAARHPRAIDYRTLRQMISTRCSSCNVTSDSKNDGDARHSLRRAITDAIDDQSIVIVCGTAFIMSQCRAELGIIEPRDGDILSSSDSNDTNSADAQEYFKQN